MPKSLADGHIKLTLLTEKPDNPAAPTLAELAAGIDIECSILASDLTWSVADSDKVAEKAACDLSNANALGPSNYQAGLTFFRYFDEVTKNADLLEDIGFQAVKAKGTTVWGYARETAKESTEPWAADDEIYLGLEVLTDSPQKPQNAGGYIKRRVPMEPQRGWENIAVAAA